MKRFIKPLFFVVIIGTLFCWGIMSAYQALRASMAPTASFCLVSPLSSDEAAQSMSCLFEQAILKEKKSFPSAVAAVRENFPHCASVRCRQQSSGIVQARIDLDEPLYALNDAMVLTRRGACVVRSLYADEVLVGLPQVYIKEGALEGASLDRASLDRASLDRALSSRFLAFLRHVPESLFLTHDGVYFSEDKIFFMPHDAGRCPYLCAVDTVIDTALLTRCDKVVADFEQIKMANKKKSSTVWVLDLRFDKQIILYPDMGGQVHG